MTIQAFAADRFIGRMAFWAMAPPLHEQHFVVRWNGQEFAQVCLRLLRIER